MLTRPSDDNATACLDIDLSALLHNYQALRQRAGTAEVAPVVKADGYGLGAGPIAGHLARIMSAHSELTPWQARTVLAALAVNAAAGPP